MPVSEERFEWCLGIALRAKERANQRLNRLSDQMALDDTPVPFEELKQWPEWNRFLMRLNFWSLRVAELEARSPHPTRLADFRESWPGRMA